MYIHFTILPHGSYIGSIHHGCVEIPRCCVSSVHQQVPMYSYVVVLLVILVVVPDALGRDQGLAVALRKSVGIMYLYFVLRYIRTPTKLNSNPPL